MSRRLPITEEKQRITEIPVWAVELTELVQQTYNLLDNTIILPAVPHTPFTFHVNIGTDTPWVSLILEINIPSERRIELRIINAGQVLWVHELTIGHPDD